MRRRILESVGGSSAKTARDYVQDGLIAMWDGIENAGWGTHDASATVWKDLIGSTDFTLVGGVIVREKSISRETDGQWVDRVFTNYSNVMCLEIVFKKTSAVTLGSTVCSFYYTGMHMSTVYGYIQNNTLWMSDGLGVAVDQSVIISATANYNENSVGVAQYYINGSQVQGSTNDYWRCTTASIIGSGYVDSTSSRNLLGDIYCVRLYNRNLTVEEVESNNAVDRERFGLS